MSGKTERLTAFDQGVIYQSTVDKCSVKEKMFGPNVKNN